MNLLIELDAASLVLRFTFEGPLTDATLIAGLAEAPKVVKVYPGCRGILDFSRVSEYDLSPDVLRQLAKSAPVIPAGYDRVFVARRITCTVWPVCSPSLQNKPVPNSTSCALCGKRSAFWAFSLPSSSLCRLSLGKGLTDFARKQLWL